MPAALVAVMRRATAEPTSTERPERHDPIVLLAEDDDELRRLLARKLRRVGCDVLEARNGVQLVELVVEHAPEPFGPREPPASLGTPDVAIPGRSGLDVLRLLRRADVTVPILLMTAFGDPELHAQALGLGATAVYDKPVDLDELAAAVCRHLLIPRAWPAEPGPA